MPESLSEPTADAPPTWPEPLQRPTSAVFSPNERTALHAYDERARAYAATLTAEECETALARELLSRSHALLPAHPYLMMWEWEVDPGWSQFGKGDMVFTDGLGAFAVVELKWIGGGSGHTARVARRKRRRKVEEQAGVYGQIVCRLFQPPRPVLAHSYTEVRPDLLFVEGRFRWTGEDVEELEVTEEERYGLPRDEQTADA